MRRKRPPEAAETLWSLSSSPKRRMSAIAQLRITASYVLILAPESHCKPVFAGPCNEEAQDPALAPALIASLRRCC